MEAHSQPPSDPRPLDGALDRLRRDLREDPAIGRESEETIDPSDAIDYASLEFEVERMRKRLAVWEIFLAYMRDGARSWLQVQKAFTPEDLERITTICGGVPLRDLMLEFR
jgi:hypothetical protein